MGWQISNIDNTVKISKALAKKLLETQEDDSLWYDLEDVAYNGKLLFNGDHMEHMDYLSNEDDIMKVLLDAKVEGRITFGSLDGDDFGCFWGFDFDGKGSVTRLKGSLTWEADSSTPEDCEGADEDTDE